MCRNRQDYGDVLIRSYNHNAAARALNSTKRGYEVAVFHATGMGGAQ